MNIKITDSFFLALTILFLWLGCGSEGANEESVDTIPIKTAKVSQKEISFPILTSGILIAAREMRLSFKIGGIVEKIFVDEGESVKKDQLLAQLDLREIQAQVSQARSAFEKAKRDYQRAKNLYADSVVTLEQLQNAETGLEVAKANLEIAEFNLKHSKIVAQSNGIILKRFVEVNELVGPGVPVFYFGTTGNKWRVKMGVTETDIIQLQLGDSASISFDAYPRKHFPAKVTEIAESADPMSGTFEVEVQLDPQKLRLVSGFVARVEIFPSKVQKYFLIPVEALVEADENSGYVFAVENNAIKKMPIEIGGPSGVVFEQNVVVRSGLESVTEVVTDGVQYLTEESEVEIVNE